MRARAFCLGVHPAFTCGVAESYFHHFAAAMSGRRVSSAEVEPDAKRSRSSHEAATSIYVRGAEGEGAGEGLEACTARLARAVEAFAHVLSESLIEAVLRSGEVGSGEVPSQEVFASLTPLLRELAADLHRVGGATPATWRAVGELAQSARDIGMRCLPNAYEDPAASPQSWTRGLDGWLEACDGLAESVLGRAAY